MVTDSFHGFCYSVIFDRNLTVIPNEIRGLSRFESLCDMTGLKDRMFFSIEEMLQKKPWETPVDYIKVRETLEPLIM